MKQSFILCFALYLPILIGCDNKTYSYLEYGLNRPVKSVKVKTYEATLQFGEIIKGDLDSDDHYLVEFNDIGNIISFSKFNIWGDMDEVIKYKYNDDMSLIEVATYNNEGNIERVTKCIYNEDKNLIETSTFYDTGSLYSRYSYEYSGQFVSKVTLTRPTSHTIESGKVTTDGNVVASVTEYKREGKTLKEEIYYNYGKLSSIRKYSRYDKNGSEWVTYDKDGNEQSKDSDIKNNHGRIFRKIVNNEIVVEIIWNDKGMPIFLKNAKLYNNSFILFDSEESVFHIEYEYDKKGNWIKQTVFEGEASKLLKISERVITY